MKMYKQIAFILLASIALISCQQEEEKKSVSPLVEYKSILDTLDDTKMSSGKIAGEKFHELFSGQDSTLADSAYILFDHFHTRLAEHMNKDFAADSSRYYATKTFAMHYGDTIAEAASQATKDYYQEMMNNGFGFRTEGDSMLVYQKGDFLGMYIYEHLSPEMQFYTRHLEKYGVVQNGMLMLQPYQIAYKAANIDTFVNHHNSFHYLPELNAAYKNYMSILLQGVPVDPIVEKGTLSPHYDKALDYIAKHFATTQTVKMMSEVYGLIKAGKAEQAKNLTDSLQQEGIIVAQDVIR